MRKLHRVEEDNHLLRIVNLGSGRAGRLECLGFALPHLLLSFVIVSSISEVFDGVDIERVLALADDGFAFDCFGFVDLVVNFLAVVLQSLLD